MKMPQQMLLRATGASSFSGSSSSGSAASSFGAPSLCFSALMSSSFCRRFSACATELSPSDQNASACVITGDDCQSLSGYSVNRFMASALTSAHQLSSVTLSSPVIPSQCCQQLAG